MDRMTRMSPFPLGGTGMVTLPDSVGPLGIDVFWPLTKRMVELENAILTESYRPEVTEVERMLPGTYLPGIGSRSNFGTKRLWPIVRSPVCWGKPATWSWTLLKLV